MKKLIQLLEAKVKLNSSGCPNIEVDSDIGLDLVNDALLSGICSAAKAAGVNVKITTAVSDHPVETDSGSISRHSTGNGVDISIINGKAVKDASNRPNVDNFVSKLEQLGYVRNSEGSNKKSVLWQMADHYNHVHVSNMEETSSNSGTSGESGTNGTSGTSGANDIDTIAKQGSENLINGLLSTAFGNTLGLKEQRVNKEISKIKNLLK
jgi:hypothetical protein